MNDHIRLLLSHRSIRLFQDIPITDELIQNLVKSAQAASTSSLMQPYSIIGVKNKKIKEQLAHFSGNKFVAKNGHFFVFCMDLHRHKLSAEIEGYNVEDFIETIESVEWFMFGLIDTAIAAQSLAIAAESMGLGICYIGGLRNNLKEVSKILKTPDRVIPLFGMCVGYPEQDPDIKPRISVKNVYHEDIYMQDDKLLKKQLAEYNEYLSSYYKRRTGGVRADKWTQKVRTKLESTERLYINEFLKQKKIPLN